MNVWINQMAEITGMRQFGFDFSISDIGSLVHEPFVSWIIAVVTLSLIPACENTYSYGQQNRNSDIEQN